VNIYLAGPLFTMAEREWNLRFAEALAANIDQSHEPNVFLPQIDCGDCFQQDDPGAAVFRRCCEMIRNCQAVVAILDGADADAGTAYEIAYTKNATIAIVIGVRTDTRPGQEKGVNYMLSQGCDEVVVASADDDTVSLARKVVSAIQERFCRGMLSGRPVSGGTE